MANQTDLLNVSDEMKLDDMRQELCGSECGEELCSSSSDTTEELYSSSEPDTGSHRLRIGWYSIESYPVLPERWYQGQPRKHHRWLRIRA